MKLLINNLFNRKSNNTILIFSFITIFLILSSSYSVKFRLFNVLKALQNKDFNKKYLPKFEIEVEKNLIANL